MFTARRLVVGATLALASLALPVPNLTATASASAPTAIVSMGDSFISGEGGRWQGNSTDGWDPDRDGTDRAYRSKWWGWSYDYDAVYPGSVGNGCHRSDVAEIKSAAISVDEKINLACSGAVAENIWRSSNGGTTFKGEAPQADQLAGVAAQYDVQMIVVSIGGNDLGFADVLTACFTAYVSGGAACNTAQQAVIDEKMPTMLADAGKAIDEIRAVMSDAGQSPASYQLVVQSYPSPLPRASEMRYPESGWSRVTTGGCPVWDADADWARDSMVPAIDAALQGLAESKGASFLSLRDAFEGREICSTSSRLVIDDGDTPDSSAHEWMRFLVSGAVQGDLQESIHPNAFGQQALGACLTQLHAQAAGSWRCTNTAGSGSASMALAPA